MPVNSPLSHITDVISQVNASAQSYRTVLQRNEAATRAALVDPVLRVLGWDTANTHMVEIEKTSGGAGIRVDYALHDSHNKVRAIIEAKSLGGNLGQVQTIIQLFTYAANYQLGDIWLTDGQYWHHHKAFNAANPAPSKVLSLTDNDPVEIATYLVEHFDAAKFWPTEPSIDVLTQEISKLRQEICTMQNEYTLLEQRLKKLEISPRKVLAQTSSVTPRISPPSNTPSPNSSAFINLSTLLYRGGMKPKRLQLPDGVQEDVTSWSQLLKKCCEYVLTKNPNLSFPVPDASGRSVSLLSFTSLPPDRTHATLQYQNQLAYIYLHYSGANCILNAIYVLGLLQDENSGIGAAVLCQ